MIDSQDFNFPRAIKKSFRQLSGRDDVGGNIQEFINIDRRVPSRKYVNGLGARVVVQPVGQSGSGKHEVAARIRSELRPIDPAPLVRQLLGGIGQEQRASPCRGMRHDINVATFIDPDTDLEKAA